MSMRKYFVLLALLASSVVLAADQIRAVRLLAPTSGTQDYTISGFGTADAAIVFAHNSADGSDADDQIIGVGFWDGATNDNEFSTFVGQGDALTSSDYSRFNSTNVVYLHSYHGTKALRTATIASTTDGVTLSWNTESDWQPYVTVLLIQCGSGNAYAGYTTLQADASGTKDVTGITDGGSFTPNFIFLFGTYIVTLDSDAAIQQNLSLGFASNDGGLVNMAQAYQSRGVSGTATKAISDRSIASLIAGSSDTATTSSVTAMASGQFTIADPDGEYPNRQSYFGYLACEFTDVPEIFNAATPTSGSWDFGGQSQERQSFLIMTSAVDGLNSLDNGGDQSTNIGYYFVSQDEEYGFSCTNTDGVATTDAHGRHSNSMMIQESPGGAPIFEMSSPTFDASGLVVTPTTFDATPRYVVGVGFGAASSSDLLLRRRR